MFDISIVIPLLNEQDSLKELASWIDRVLKEKQLSYEIIFVDDGSNDNSWNIIKELCAANPHIKGIKFQRNYGKSAALNTAFNAANGSVVFTMDADLQDSPDELPEMYNMIVNEGYDLVSGWKIKRLDPLSKTIPTKLFNWATRKMSGLELHDFNCGLKAYRSNVVKSIEVYGEMHRYIPVIAKWAGFKKITEKPVKHYERKFGQSKFGLERFVNGFLDLLTITFVSRFGKRPMHFFGFIGTLMFLIGGLVSAYLIVEKVVNLYRHAYVRDVTDQPLFYLALTAMIIGTQLFLAGFLGELIARNSPYRNSYLIESELNLK
ncbi:MAG: glycosyltransferase family 2 protein [Bacteroidia bacterium]|nr:glycosyltransferase family 2 protein [Bacteroidia bacterium]MCZ2247852.1 glycosyltransferase family 2 protein [Bacteroidia bacterium]